TSSDHLAELHSEAHIAVDLHLALHKRRRRLKAAMNELVEIGSRHSNRTARGVLPIDGYSIGASRAIDEQAAIAPKIELQSSAKPRFTVYALGQSVSHILQVHLSLPWIFSAAISNASR